MDKNQQTISDTQMIVARNMTVKELITKLGYTADEILTVFDSRIGTVGLDHVLDMAWISLDITLNKA